MSDESGVKPEVTEVQPEVGYVVKWPGEGDPGVIFCLKSGLMKPEMNEAVGMPVFGASDEGMDEGHWQKVVSLPVGEVDEEGNVFDKEGRLAGRLVGQKFDQGKGRSEGIFIPERTAGKEVLVQRWNNEEIGRRTFKDYEVLRRLRETVNVDPIKSAAMNMKALRMQYKTRIGNRRIDVLSRFRTKRFPLDTELDKHFESILETDGSIGLKRSDTQVYQGVPDYIPEGLSDMGDDPRVDSVGRNREKILVDKVALFKEYRDVFEKVIGEDLSDAETVDLVAREIFKRRPYAEDRSQIDFGGKTLLIGDLKQASKGDSKRYAVCRHHALEAAVLLQAMGVEVRLIKNRFQGQRHAANLVRFEGQWHILDVTNPKDMSSSNFQPYVQEIPGAEGDVSEWKEFFLPGGKG